MQTAASCLGAGLDILVLLWSPSTLTRCGLLLLSLWDLVELLLQITIFALQFGNLSLGCSEILLSVLQKSVFLRQR